LVSPLAMNMHVAALPEIARALKTDASTAQFSLVSFLVALAGGQIVYGAASDRFGRKRPLIAGSVLFVCASIGASLSTDMTQFIGWRFAQGLGACAGQAIPRAMIRDLHSGPAAARLKGSFLLMISIAPLLAPMVGSGLIAAPMAIDFPGPGTRWAGRARSGRAWTRHCCIMSDSREDWRRSRPPCLICFATDAFCF
jgi:DHA1 family bicyclomycin/chloramphenicol resistance-like MFS transporter